MNRFIFSTTIPVLVGSIIHTRIPAVPYGSIFSLSLACFSPRVARPRPPFETHARASPAKLALGRIGIFRTVSRASSKGLASSRAASSTRTRFNTIDAGGVTCDTDRPLAR